MFTVIVTETRPNLDVLFYERTENAAGDQEILKEYDQRSGLHSAELTYSVDRLTRKAIYVWESEEALNDFYHSTSIRTVYEKRAAYNEAQGITKTIEKHSL